MSETSVSEASVFRGRTIQVVRDFSPDEQWFLYEQTRRLKTALAAGQDTAAFRVENRDLSLYLLFMEDSTRTKESFRNAAGFHGLRVNDFNTAVSSFKKNESLSDTVKMLVGYAEQSIFVVRSKMEGVCRWLEQYIGDYAASAGLPRPAFINAGDGRHEHPTQEFLDEFSFLEHRNWDRSNIHIALVGDLFHGRTVHSKVEGLRVFREVKVDLVAPEQLDMPPYYVEQMRAHGFSVRLFPSIEDYLSCGDVADTWYFTRLQLERMGDRLLDRADALRRTVTFRREFLDTLPQGTRFFHPLPRHAVTPTIPTWLDATPLNGWDRQSMNGYFTRIVEIALLAGRLGSEFKGRTARPGEFRDDFVVEVPVYARSKPEYKIGIKPVENGIVIDHIWKQGSPGEIWDHINKIRSILDLNVVSSHGVFQSLKDGVHKGIVSLPGILNLDERRIKMLGAIAPGCTLNIVQDGRVKQKFRMHMPMRVYGFEEIGCTNEDCVSHPSHNEPVVAEFLRSNTQDRATFVCRYCEKPHDFQSIWR